MSRHEKICYRCKKRKATYSLQLMHSNQLRTKPVMCVFCALNQTRWVDRIKVLSNPKEYKNLNRSDLTGRVVIYRNPKAVSAEMKEIFGWTTAKFNRYILALSEECGFSAVLGHFFITRRRIRLFLVAVVKLFQKFAKEDLLFALDHAEDFADHPENEIDIVTNKIKEIYDNHYKHYVVNQYEGNRYDNSSEIINLLILALTRHGKINFSSSVLPRILINTSEVSLKYLFYVFAHKSMEVDKKFITSDVKALAKVAYENRDSSVMPILADALQEAGCESKMILKQCREGYYYRGCKILDSILDKS